MLLTAVLLEVLKTRLLRRKLEITEISGVWSLKRPGVLFSLICHTCTTGLFSIAVWGCTLTLHHLGVHRLPKQSGIRIIASCRVKSNFKWAG